jgi:spore maturation protein CgeB
VKAIVVHPGHDYSTADVYRGWMRGLAANGVDVRPFNLGERLTFYGGAHLKAPDGEFRAWFDDPADVARAVGHGLHSACYQFQPDVVVVISAAYLPVYVYDMIRERGSKVVVIHTESPYEDRRQLFVAPHADVNLINDPTHLDLWRAEAPTWYLPHAYDPTVHRPGPSNWDFDVAWVGTAGDMFPARTRFLEAVEWGSASVALAGMWRGDENSPLARYFLDGMTLCVDNDTTVDLYRGSRITFNLYRCDGTDDLYSGAWAMGPREVEAAATGIFLARHSPTDHGGEGDEVLSMLPTFTEPGELTEILAHYLAHPAQREQLAARARAAVADRTFEAHAAQLLQRLDT